MITPYSRKMVGTGNQITKYSKKVLKDEWPVGHENKKHTFTQQ